MSGRKRNVKQDQWNVDINLLIKNWDDARKCICYTCCNYRTKNGEHDKAYKLYLDILNYEGDKFSKKFVKVTSIN